MKLVAAAHGEYMDPPEEPAKKRSRGPAEEHEEEAEEEVEEEVGLGGKP